LSAGCVDENKDGAAGCWLSREATDSADCLIALVIKFQHLIPPLIEISYRYAMLLLYAEASARGIG
jgi:hypothetical protein